MNNSKTLFINYYLLRNSKVSITPHSIIYLLIMWSKASHLNSVGIIFSLMDDNEISFKLHHNFMMH